MTKKQYEELGKGLINLANLIGGLSFINAMFGQKHNLPVGTLIFLLSYIFIALYISGIILVGIGEKND